MARWRTPSQQTGELVDDDRQKGFGACPDLGLYVAENRLCREFSFTKLRGCMDYHFVFATDGTIPAGAQPNGNEANGDPLWVARSPGVTDPFFSHGIHPGK